MNHTHAADLCGAKRAERNGPRAVAQISFFFFFFLPGINLRSSDTVPNVAAAYYYRLSLLYAFSLNVSQLCTVDSPSDASRRYRASRAASVTRPPGRCRRKYLGDHNILCKDMQTPVEMELYTREFLAVKSSRKRSCTL